jgi:hypothetical protein
MYTLTSNQTYISIDTSDVEDGGGTSFPFLDITVQPKKGNALLWPSVLDEDPEKKDRRTEHEALPVLKGIKYGKQVDEGVMYCVDLILYLALTYIFGDSFFIQVLMLGFTQGIIQRPKRTIVLE